VSYHRHHSFRPSASLSAAVLRFQWSKKFELLRSYVTGFAATLLIIFIFLFAAKLMRVGEESRAGTPTKGNLTPSALIAATNVDAREFAAVGQQAKLINASLPFDTGPLEAARPFPVDIEDANYPRALFCLRAAVYHEAGFEPLTGRRAVAQVILNRVRHSAYPKSICDVVYQGYASPVCQFSFACDRARHRPVATTAWQEAEQVAADALAGYVEPSVGTSTHYHADYVAPRWSPLLTKVSKIGTHIFYRWPGSWGQRAAFSRRYLGEQASTIGRAMELEAATEEAVDIHGLRGVAVVEVRDGKLAPEAVRGVKHRGVRVQVGDVWDLGPNEQLVTATLIARLVEQGLLKWDAPLAELLPDAAQFMSSELQSVTLVQLLSDASILSANKAPALATDTGARSLVVQPASYLEQALNPTTSGKSNSMRDPGLAIAAAAAERATGRSYEDMVREEIFKPLGMRSAGFAASSKGSKPSERRASVDPNPSSPRGGMHMSLRDFGTFITDQDQGLTGGGKLLSAATYRRLHKPLDSRPGQPKDDAAWVVKPFHRSLLGKSLGQYWIAGANFGAKGSNKLIVVPIPEGKNALATFGRAIKAAQAQ